MRDFFIACWENFLTITGAMIIWPAMMARDFPIRSKVFRTLLFIPLVIISIPLTIYIGINEVFIKRRMEKQTEEDFPDDFPYMGPEGTNPESSGLSDSKSKN